MTLTEIKEYVQQRKVVSLKEVALHFKADESAVVPMVERWVEKEKIKKVEMTAGQCAGCTSCDSSIRVHYEWLGDQSISIVRPSR